MNNDKTINSDTEFFSDDMADYIYDIDADIDANIDDDIDTIGSDSTILVEDLVNYIEAYEDIPVLAYIPPKKIDLLPDQLMLSCKTGDIDTCNQLITIGVDVNAYDGLALRLACHNEHLLIVDLLLKNGADPKMYDNAAFKIACQSCYIDIIQKLLISGADINANDGWAISYCSENGLYDTVKLLLQYDADVHSRNDYPLKWSSTNGRYYTVELLLDSGADVHSESDFALRWASRYGHVKVVELLIKYGADIHAMNDYAIYWANINNHDHVVDLLLYYGADINCISDSSKNETSIDDLQIDDIVDDVNTSDTVNILDEFSLHDEWQSYDPDLWESSGACFDKFTDPSQPIVSKKINKYTESLIQQYEHDNDIISMIKLISESTSLDELYNYVPDPKNAKLIYCVISEDINNIITYMLNPNKQDRWQIALLVSIFNNNKVITELILHHCTIHDVNVLNGIGLTIACMHGQYDIANLLLDIGADMYLNDRMAIYYGLMYDSNTFGKLFIKYGLNEEYIKKCLD